MRALLIAWFARQGRGRLSPVLIRLLLSVLCPVLFVSCRSPVNSITEQRFEFSQPQMGLPFRIVLYASNSDRAQKVSDAAFARIKELNGILSDYEEESELSRLSRTSGSQTRVHVSEDLWRVLAKADQVSKMSEGAFDITVGPLVDLWKRARRQRQLPNPDRLAEARNAVGYRFVKLYPARHEVELTAKGMRLDLGGIAKGYALDEAARVLRSLGVRRYLVAGSGDMVLGDPPPKSDGWKIELAPLDVTNAPPARFVHISNRSLTTSGDLFQHVEIGGKRYSHIVDPRTGVGLTDHSLVRMIANDGITADALSKVVSVLGPDKGVKTVASVPGVETYVLRIPSESVEETWSPGFRKYIK